jgi:hypothetical protein
MKKQSFLKYVGITAALAIFISITAIMQKSGKSAATTIASGDYNGLLIAVDSDRQLITGYFDSTTGNGQFSCIFYIRGNINSSNNKIKTWFPDETDPQLVIEGVIEKTSVNGKPAVIVKLKEEHGGCWNVQRFAEKDSTPFNLTTINDWKEIRVVSSRRAYFHDTPQISTKRKTYIVRGDALRITQSIEGWVHAEYVNPDGQRASGWVKESELFSSYPP